MNALLAALGVSVVLPFAVITDNQNCTGLEARWQYSGAPIVYRINTTSAPFAGIATETQNALGHWNAVASSVFTYEYSSSATSRGFNYDGTNSISYGDPSGDLGSGVLAATIAYRDFNAGGTHSFNGKTWRTINEMDIVFNNGISFVANDSIGGGCSNEFSYEAVLTHESGHGFGLDHPDQCISTGDPEQQYEGYYDAVMYSAIGPCDASKNGLEFDDLQGITWLYDSGAPLVYPDFSAFPGNGYAPLDVQFTDESIGATAWSWSFGDGGSSTSQNPSHTYQNAGTFTVNMQANGEPASPVTVFVYAKPFVDFEGDVTEGVHPVTVNFTNLSSGTIYSYEWDFGDGVLSTEENPAHEYLYKGEYTVTLTAMGQGGEVEAVKTNYIVVKGKGQQDEGSGNPFADALAGMGCQCGVAPARPGRALGGSALLLLAALGVALRRRQ